MTLFGFVVEASCYTNMDFGVCILDVPILAIF